MPTFCFSVSNDYHGKFVLANDSFGALIPNSCFLSTIGGHVIGMFMILREKRLIRLKVNLVTSRHSLVELRKGAAELAKRL